MRTLRIHSLNNFYVYHTWVLTVVIRNSTFLIGEYGVQLDVPELADNIRSKYKRKVEFL